MEIVRGQITKTVYSLIKDEKHSDAVVILEQLLELQPTSRAALSLLGHCYYHLQNFSYAGLLYEKLANLYPEFPEYQFHHAQCLYNATDYEAALNTSYLRGEPSEELQEQVMKLQAAIQYCRDENADAKTLLDGCSKIDPFTEVGKGCLVFKEGDYHAASRHFEAAANIVGDEPFLWYNRAVSAYHRGDMPSAAHYIGDIIERGAIENPELCVGVQEDKQYMTSVGNTSTLSRTAMIEALNLKAAIEFSLHKYEAARETMADLPKRLEEEVDPLSLHNIALLNMPSDALEGIRKLRFLLDQPTFPPETFQNILVLYCRYEQYDLIADLLAVYQEYRMKYLTHDFGNFCEALTKKETAPQEAIKLFDDLTTNLADTMRKLVKKVDKITGFGDEAETKDICNSYDDVVDQFYMPALMALGKLYWDQEEIFEVEKTLKQGAEFVDDRDAWVINVANCVYKRGAVFQEAAGLYEMVVRKHQKTLLDVSAMCLANLCVCYVLLSRNEEAELLIKNIELQEAEILHNNPGVKVFHSCIINLVIGTLYCVKKNYEFGIIRIIKSFDDLNTKLGPDTWFYAKRCFLALIEKLVKNSVTIQEEVLNAVVVFLTRCEDMGQNISTVIEEANVLPANGENIPANFGTHTVTYEARYLRFLFTQFLDQGVA